MSETINVTGSINVSVPISGVTFTPSADPVVLPPNNAGAVLGTLMLDVIDPSFPVTDAVWTANAGELTFSGTGGTVNLVVGATSIPAGPVVAISFSGSVTV